MANSWTKDRLLHSLALHTERLHHHEVPSSHFAVDRRCGRARVLRADAGDEVSDLAAAVKHKLGPLACGEPQLLSVGRVHDIRVRLRVADVPSVAIC